jgi:hypothetical protein
LNRPSLWTVGKLVLALTAVAALPSAGAGGSSELAVPPIAAPVIDGLATTADEWQGAATLTGWADNILGILNQDKTIVSVGHHQGTLYVQMVYPIAEAFRRDSVFYSELPLKKSVSVNDGDIRQDDYLGFYLAAGEGDDVYFFGVNAANAKLDSKNGDAAWNSGQWQVGQKWDPNFWRVEFSLPLSEFPGSQPQGINFAHGARQVEFMESIWAYEPARKLPLARARLTTDKVAVTLLDFGDLNDGTLAFSGRVANLGNTPVTLQTTVAVTNAEGDERQVIFGATPTEHQLQPGESKSLTADFEVPGALYGDVTVQVGTGKGKPLLDYRLPFVFPREIHMETRFIPTPELLLLKLFLGADAAAKASGVTVELVAGDTGETVLTRRIADLQALDKIEIDCRQLPVGSYDIVTTVKLGAESVSLKGSLTKEPQPEWLNNTIGISETVPVPWTPLAMAGRRASCWGRDYDFGAAGFPAQINILGKDILTGPVRVSATIDGEAHVLDAGTLEATEQTAARVSFKTTADAGAVSVEADTWIEFDGFVWNTMTFAADAGVKLQAVSVVIPLKREYATLWWSGESIHRSAMINSTIGTPPQSKSASAPQNFLRLGDEERGIQFYYESFHGWHVTQTLIPGETDYVLRYDAKPVQAENPRPLVLGYMALPCKPRSPYFRRIDGVGWSRSKLLDRAGVEKVGDLFQVMPYSEGWNNHYNYLNFWNEDVFEKDYLEKHRNKWRKEWAEKKHTFSMYINSGVLDANTPEYRKYRFEWQPVPGNAPHIPPDPKTRDKSYLVNGCTNTRSAADFLMWHLDKTVKYLSDDGEIPVHAYIDCYSHHNKACSNVLHDCPPEGTIPVLATREYLKRIYTIYKSINPLNQVVLHTGGENSLSAASFTDVMLDGEQFRAPYYSNRINDPSLPKNYTRMLNLTRVKSLIQRYAWGPERYHLYQFWKWTENEPDNARPARAHLWALLFAHDVPCWSAGTPANIPRAIRELGWDEKVEFIPYWRKETGIEVSSTADPVVASTWRRGDGNLLVMVVNDSDTADVSRLKVDFAGFGFKPGPVTCRDYGAAGLGYPDSVFLPEQQRRQPPHYLEPDAVPVKESTVVQAADLAVEVKEHSYRMLRFFQ